MPYTPVLATLGYVLSPDRSRVLMVRRSRDGDVHQGKYNGLGGKLETDEDVVGCMIRELREETGIEVTSLRLRGTLSWPGFGNTGEEASKLPPSADWFGFIFVVDAFTGEPPDHNDDGPLEWVEIDRLGELPMWEGDQHFLPLVFGDGPAFHGVMPYRDGRPVSWSYTLLG
ncbi:MAG: 8-oxo-dGTP diphosphatase [Propionicimonas sp.]